MALSNDLQCIHAIKQGNIDAFEYFVNRYQVMVYTIIVKIVNNKHTAEDLTQDVFIKAFSSIHKFREEALFSTWLYRIAYNTSINEVRKKKLNFSLNAEVNNLTDEEDYELNGIPKEYLLNKMETIVNKLAGADALLINLFYQGEQSIEQISEISGLSIANVKVKLHRIRKRIYNELIKQINDE